MQTKCRLLFLAIITLLAMYGCNDAKEDIDSGNYDKEKITIIATVGDTNLHSRTTFEDKGADGIKQFWEDGDRFDLYDSDDNYTATFEVESGKGGRNKAEFTFMSGTLPVENQSYTAVYPSINNTPTLNQRAKEINGKKQVGNGSLDHIDSQCYMNSSYTHSSKAGTISFVMDYVMITVKLEKPDNYDINTHGTPACLTFFNGDKSTSLTLEGISDWEETITAYMIIEPVEETTERTLYFDLLCSKNYLAQKKLTSSKLYQRGMRYTADLTAGNKPQLLPGYTITQSQNIPDDLDTWVITSTMSSTTRITTLVNKLNSVDPNRKIRLVLPNATGITTNANYGTFRGCTSLTSLSMPKITTIPAQAFMNCSSLTSIDMPAATTIGSSVFLGCTSLSSVNLPAVTTISGNAFEECTSLTSVSLPKIRTIEDETFNNCSALTSIDLPAATTINFAAFNGCTSLITVNLPGITTVGQKAFYGCTSLSSVNLPNVTTIEVQTFYGCNNLVSINLPKAIAIGESAFYDCTLLSSISLPVATTINNTVFANCKSLSSISLPKVTSVGDNSFANCNGLKTLEIATISGALNSTGTLFTSMNGILIGVDLSVGKGEANYVNNKTWRGYSFKSISVAEN